MSRSRAMLDHFGHCLAAASIVLLIAAIAAEHDHHAGAVVLVLGSAFACLLGSAAAWQPPEKPGPCGCRKCSRPGAPHCPDCKVVVIFDPPDVWRTVSSERIACARHADPVSRQLLSAELEAEMPADLAAKFGRRM